MVTGTRVKAKGGCHLLRGVWLKYGITLAFSAKTDVTMRFPVENYPIDMISRLFIFSYICPLHTLSLLSYHIW
jgi:hypothetical protein